MKSFVSLVCAIEFIEDNLRYQITVTDVAEASYISLSHLQAMFSRTLYISIGEYIAKRKLCIAARDLIHSDRRVTDIAFDFGYANVESFTRAFKKQFLCTPSAYRKLYHFSDLYPRLIISEKEGFDMTKKYDLSEISDKILASKGCYIIAADIDHLLPINEKWGRGAGDMAIAQTAARIGDSIAPGMDYFRIGNDSFVVLTGSHDVAVAEDVARKIIAHADDEVHFGDVTFTFTISMGIVKIPLDIKDAKQSIDRSDAAMMAAKHEGRNCYKVM